MTFLVTLTCDSSLFLEIWAFLNKYECILQQSLQNEAFSDEYQSDENDKNWFHPNLKILITIAGEKLQYSGFSDLRERAIMDFNWDLHTRCGKTYLRAYLLWI